MHNAMQSAQRNADHPEAEPAVPHHTYTTPAPTPQHATSAVDVLAAAVEALRERGISNPSQFAALGAEAILGTLRWFDAPEQRRRGVGTGVLVTELRAGGKPGWQKSGSASVLDRQRQYGHDIADWLNEHFPALREPSGNPHPAAVAAVVRLHHLHGKGRLTVGEHGPEIRSAVAVFRKRWETDRSSDG